VGRRIQGAGLGAWRRALVSENSTVRAEVRSRSRERARPSPRK
jgi:hypothetical protein